MSWIFFMFCSFSILIVIVIYKALNFFLMIQNSYTIYVEIFWALQQKSYIYRFSSLPVDPLDSRTIIFVRHAKLPVVSSPCMSLIRSAFEHRIADLFSGSTLCILFSLIIDVHLVTFERIYFTAVFKFTKNFIIFIYVSINRTRSSLMNLNKEYFIKIDFLKNYLTINLPFYRLLISTFRIFNKNYCFCRFPRFTMSIVLQDLT